MAGEVAGSGVTSAVELPLEWGKEKNVRWRVDLPEAGNSTPIVHRYRILVTQPVTAEKGLTQRIGLPEKNIRFMPTSSRILMAVAYCRMSQFSR